MYLILHYSKHKDNYNFLENAFFKGIFPFSFGAVKWRILGIN